MPEEEPSCLERYLSECAGADAQLTLDLIEAGNDQALQRAAIDAHQARIDSAYASYLDCTGGGGTG